MKKSAISLFIVLLLMLTACSQDNTVPTVTEESSPSATVSAIVSPTPDPATSEPPDIATSEPTEASSPAAISEPTEQATSQATDSPTRRQTEAPPVTPPPTEPPVSSDPTPTTFNINDWTTLARNYGESIGLIYDSGTTGSWDTPIAAGPTLKSTESNIKDRLNRYKSEGIQYFCVWAEARTDGSGKYDIYIGYA